MKDKKITFVFCFYIVFFMILHILISDQKISFSERRELAVFPKFEITNEYITKIDKYLLDHFPFRNVFRSVKANYNYKILNKLDNNNIYLKGDYIYKSNYPTDKKSISNFINKINMITNEIDNHNMYIMIIPDKNYYLDDLDFLQIDYDYIYGEISKLGLINIDIRDIMEINDYYKTDTHWKQENLNKVIKKMCLEMNNDFFDIEYGKNIYDKFYGVYYGEAAINNGNGEELIYLSNKILDNIDIYYLENEELKKIYNLEKLSGLDSYEIFLDGASSYIEISNNNSYNNKELVIFRDSFASSLVPLLVPYYKNITLIDTRYINSEIYMDLVDFKDKDILFMYSTLIINNSYSLK